MVLCVFFSWKCNYFVGQIDNLMGWDHLTIMLLKFTLLPNTFFASNEIQ